MTTSVAGAQTIKDSAGIRIVTSAKPSWTPTQQLRLSAAPTLVIGDRDEERYQLSRVKGAFRMGDGRVLIAEATTPELRFYDAKGNYLTKFGGKGDGPGEFREMENVFRLAGDTIAVFHERDAISRFAPSGNFIKRSDETNGVPTSRSAATTATTAIIPLNAGSRLLQKKTLSSNAAPGEIYNEMTQHFVADASNMVVRDLGMLPVSQRLGKAGTSDAIWLAPNELVTQRDGSSFYLGFGEQYSVTRYSSAGSPDLLVRRAWSPPLVTAAELNEYKEYWLTLWSQPGADRAKYRKVLDENRYSSTLPAFSALVLDNTGKLWVRTPKAIDYAAISRPFLISVKGSSWSVFAIDGRWLGDVTMPAMFIPTAIGADYVLGIQRDEDLVPTVVSYKLSTRP